MPGPVHGSEAKPLACCIDGPAHAVPKLRYALGELLHGLGLTPVWTDAGQATLYAGPTPETAAPGALRFRLGDATWETLRSPAVAHRDALGWLHHDGRSTPLPVGPAGMLAFDPNGIVEADVIGSAFWWLSGWQQAATVERDVHGRFPYAQSLQHALSLGPAAPVDRYRLWLGEALQRPCHAVPGRTWGGKAWAVALTHDLDAVRTPRLRAFAGEMLHARPWQALVRTLGADPRRDSLDALLALARRHDARSTLFVKTVGAGSPEDVAYRLGPLAGRLRKLAAEGFEVGLHPGYASHDHAARLATERDRLGAALGAPPTAVRSHFLRWTEPTTPRLYRAAGFALDSTLGWSETPGFRRGTSHPFRLWDTAADASSDLWEMPLAVMDTTLFTHLRLPPDEAARQAQTVLDEARLAGGCAVLLWHPALAGTEWKAQQDVLDHLTGHARSGGAAVGPLGTLLNDWNG